MMMTCSAQNQGHRIGVVLRRDGTPGPTVRPDLDAEPDHLVVHEDRRLAAFSRGGFHEAICKPSVLNDRSSQGGSRADSKMLSLVFRRGGLIPA